MISSSTKRMQILIPVSGNSAFFPKEDFYFPKPLVEISGRPMIAIVVEQLQRQFKNADFIFVIDREDARGFSLDETIKLLSGPQTRIIERPGVTSGALCSCLLAIDEFDLQRNLIIANSDQIIDDNLSERVYAFQKGGAAAGVVTFDSVHPRWSYIIEDENQNVIQTFEKRVASRDAIAGFYYFQSAEIFVRAAEKVMLNCVQTEGMHYISSTLNEIILQGKRVLHSSISGLKYHSFYAPSKIEEFERTDFAARLRKALPGDRLVNVVVPAAGEGSRFSRAGWKTPKPFIEIEGKPMIEHVITNISPDHSRVTLLLRKEHMDGQLDLINDWQQRGYKILPVGNLTDGTASTVLLAHRFINDDLPVLVANSDQLVEFDVNVFIEDCFSRGLDGSIVVFKDPSMDPKWSFVRLDELGLVSEVAEKLPISDLATVGVYLFARGRDFIAGTLDMIGANDRVNGEFYTCPVFNYLIRSGARIGIYEVPHHAMSGLGTPEDLLSFLKRNEEWPSHNKPDGSK
jgi:NDP-sugar pyrophosphorylase family protein